MMVSCGVLAYWVSGLLVVSPRVQLSVDQSRGEIMAKWGSWQLLC